MEYGKNELIKNEMKKVPFFTKVLTISLGMFIFLIFFIPSQTSTWGIILFSIYLIYLLVHWNLKIKLNTSAVTMILFIILSFASALSSNSLQISINYIFSLILFFLFYLIMKSLDGWVNFFLVILKIVIFFFTIGSLLQLFAPDTLSQINMLHLTGTQLSTSLRYIRGGILVGFTSQSGINGFLISIGLVLVSADILHTKKKTLKILLTGFYLILYYLLLLTGKRGFIVFGLAIIIYIILHGTKNKLKVIIPLCFFSLVFFYLLYNTDAGLSLIQRSRSQDDFSTGRFQMVKNMWDDFASKPIWGNGTFTTTYVFLGDHGHNIYMQVLRENGIIGLALFISTLIINFIKTHKILKYYNFKTKEGRSILISVSLQLLFIFWGLTGNPLYDPFSLCIYFVAIAILETLDIKKEGILGSERKN